MLALNACRDTVPYTCLEVWDRRRQRQKSTIATHSQTENLNQKWPNNIPAAYTSKQQTTCTRDGAKKAKNKNQAAHHLPETSRAYRPARWQTRAHDCRHGTNERNETKATTPPPPPPHTQRAERKHSQVLQQHSVHHRSTKRWGVQNDGSQEPPTHTYTLPHEPAPMWQHKAKGLWFIS